MTRTLKTVALLLLAAAAARAGWVGDCGTVALSFAPDSVVATARVDTGDGPQVVDLYALLTGVPAVGRRGRTLAWVGGFELALRAGADGVRVLAKDFPTHALDLARDDPAACQAASTPGWPLHDGAAELVHWRVLVPQGTGRVAFRLADGGAPSLRRTPGLQDYPARVVWAGSAAQGLEDVLATACDAPAVLNPAPDEVAPAPHCGGRSWREVGVLKPAGETVPAAAGTAGGEAP